MGVIGSGIGGVASLAGGIIGDQMARADERRALQALKEAYGRVSNFQDSVGPSAYESVVSDPNATNAQRLAYQSLMTQGQNMGLGLQDKVALQQAMDVANQNARSNREAETASMQRRGMAGSGSEYAGRLMANQAGAQTQAQTGAQVAADSRRNALSALQAGGQAAGQFRQQGFNEASTIAQAKDARSQFNKGLEQWKVGAQNSAQGNLGNYYGNRAQKTREQGQAIGQAVGGAAGFLPF